MNKQQLFENIKKKQSFLCVGLDTDIKKIPQHLLSEEDPIFAFNKAIIDATADYCVAYKPNLAFYESLGTKGMMAFEKTVAYLRENYPDQFIIADAKRGDIGNTSEMYARSFFDHIKVDAVVPGVGAQGGSLAEVAQYGMNDQCGLLVNSSRAIIYADKTEAFANVAREAAHAVQKEMAGYLHDKGIIPCKA